MLKDYSTTEFGLNLVEKMDPPVFKKLLKLMSERGIDTAAYCAAHKLYVLEQPKKEPELLTNHHIYMLMRQLGVTEFVLETVYTIEEAAKYLALTLQICLFLRTTWKQLKE